MSSKITALRSLNLPFVKTTIALGAIYYFNEGTTYKPENEGQVHRWLTKVILDEGRRPGTLNYIFCTDDFLHNVNKEYLGHDTYTDIISFDLSEEEALVEGDIYISLDRIRENAASHNTPFEKELYRVMVHGVLHFLGYDDHSEAEKRQMRKKEEACLSLPEING